MLLSVVSNVVHDLASSPAHPPGDVVDLFVWREGAEAFVEDARGDEPGSRSCCR
jgi:hypothetical protein